MSKKTAYLYISAERREWLLGLANTSVEAAKLAVRCSELNGNPLRVDECECMIPYIWPHQTSLKKYIEGKARKAFRESVRGETVNKDFIHNIIWPDDYLAANLALGISNYSTLRKALYLATDVAICERIRSEITTRFPWG